MSQDRIVINASDLARSPELLAFAGALDAKRPTSWDQYGYPLDVTFEKLLQAYERSGAGQGAVHRLLDGCWQEMPRVKRVGDEEESAWEKKVAAEFKRVRVWAKLRDFDRRNMVGHYAGLIYRVADGKELYEPMDRAAKLV